MATPRRLSSQRPWILLALAASLVACAAREPAPPPASPAQSASAVPATKKSTADVVAAALPAVVLLLNERPAKAGGAPVTTYGAGFLTQGGLVVTSLHVVDGDGKLSAMLYEPGRAGYSPMDGGLSRFLFENHADLVPAERVAADGVTDLAVVRVGADTSHLPALVWSNEELRAGDRVLALGHPQETVWSFSEGVVGALQYGIVQHDAIVGPGSSGGPLLNERGEVVGVNVARVVNQPAGLSFARPIAMVASTFSDRKIAGSLDRSTPAAAALSCWRAQQLAHPDTGDCFDWDDLWSKIEASAREARKLAATGAARDRIDGCVLAPGARAAWEKRERESVVHVFDPTQGHGAQADADPPADSPAEGGFAADYRDPQRLARRLRNGIRVDDAHLVSPDMAWVLLASRAADGSVDQLTELYVRIQDRWVQRLWPTDAEVAALPATWPKPLLTQSGKRPQQIASILKQATSTAPCPVAPAGSAATAPGGGGRAVLRPGFALDE